MTQHSRGMHRNKSCYIVFRRNQVKTVACHDAQLDSRFRTDCINGIRENFQPTGHENIVKLPPLPEARKVHPPDEAIAIGSLLVLERWLQRRNQRIGQPSCFRFVAQPGEHLAQSCVAVALLVARFCNASALL